MSEKFWANVNTREVVTGPEARLALEKFWQEGASASYSETPKKLKPRPDSLKLLLKLSSDTGPIQSKTPAPQCKYQPDGTPVIAFSYEPRVVVLTLCDDTTITASKMTFKNEESLGMTYRIVRVPSLPEWDPYSIEEIASLITWSLVGPEVK